MNSNGSSGTPLRVDSASEVVVQLLDPTYRRPIKTWKFTDRISITIGRDANFGTIDVKDTGPGIPEEIKARLFKPFQTTKKEGTGIGLALVKRFVDNFEGSVHVDSEPGKGTTFHLKLPLADVHEHIIERPALVEENVPAV